MPKISIIIPVYNVAPYLRTCLDSILTQTFTDWEAICVDDGSTDGSGAVLDTYAQKDARFKVIHQINQGVSVARQVALESCSGAWIGAVDPDDWIAPTNFEDLYGGVQKYAVEMVWCDYFRDRGDSEQRIQVRTADDAKMNLEAILSGKIWGSLCNRLLSRKLIERLQIRFPPKGCDVGEDLSFVCEFLSCNPKIKWIPACNYHYVYRKGSLLNPLPKSDVYLPIIRSIQYLETRLGDSVDPILFLKRKKIVKSAMYDKKHVTDAIFAATFPEVRDIHGIGARFWHQILFFLAVRGFRSVVVTALKVFRAISNIFH